MWPYWLMFALPAATAALAPRIQRTVDGAIDEEWSFSWVLASIAITLAVGYRFRVGGDWGSYLNHLDAVRGAPAAEVLSMSEPGYHFANWLSVEADWGIFGANLICGGLLSAGLIMFCRMMPRPWLALAVAIPYLVIVVGMGYSRQGVALGATMLGLVALQKRSTAWFVAWVLLGATFHKTAVLLLPITTLANTRNRYWTTLWVGVVTAGAYVLLLQDSVEHLYHGYIEAQYESEGALVRLLMNALPAAILLVMWKRFPFTQIEGPLWRWLAIISLILLGVLFVSPSSTAVDRIALYMLPLQLVVFSHLPEIFGPAQRSNQGWATLVILYYAAVLFVWLNYATHAQAWLPYRFYPLENM